MRWLEKSNCSPTLSMPVMLGFRKVVGGIISVQRVPELFDCAAILCAQIWARQFGGVSDYFGVYCCTCFHNFCNPRTSHKYSAVDPDPELRIPSDEIDHSWSRTRSVDFFLPLHHSSNAHMGFNPLSLTYKRQNEISKVVIGSRIPSSLHLLSAPAPFSCE